MMTTKHLEFALLAFALVPAVVFGQADQPPTGQHGSTEFGVRHVWGDVYGRPDLPFSPDLFTSKLNEYGDLRNNFFVRRFSLRMDDLLGTKNHFSLQSESTLYKNQSFLASFGQYNRFKFQFRFDEIPHIYTNTARTLYTQTSPGVYTLPLIIRSGLQQASSTGTAAQIANSLPSYIATQVVPSSSFIAPAITRKTGTGLASFDVTPDWNIALLFSREKQFGSRPIALLFNSSPSASASGSGNIPDRQSPGTGVELPEPIHYFNNTVRAMTEYGKRNWGVQLGYSGSIFRNKIDSMVADNPFATTDVAVQLIPPGGGCTPTAPAVNCAIGAVPARGQMDLYPDNRAHYLNFASAFDLTRHLRVMGTVNPGWLRQSDPFLPYTSNTAITGLAPLPASSLGGDKQTLAMNWTIVNKSLKNVELAVKYRHYDYNNNTPILALTPIAGDVIGANSTATGQATPGVHHNKPFGFNKKTLEFSGDWFFAKRSSFKIGYEGEWFDRSHRDVEHSLENSVFAAVDISPTRDWLFRLAYRHSDRKPEKYEDEQALTISGAIPVIQPFARRFDEAARLLDRADALVQYTADRFTLAGSFQTIQNDFNRRLDVNSTTPLNFLTGAAATVAPYYLYGALKDLSHIYTFDVDYVLSKQVSLFGEYAYEKYHKRMISRNRTPASGTSTSLACGSGQACDTPNNDWESTYRDLFHTYAAGVDLYLGDRFYLTNYYSLSAGTGKVFSRALGDPTITSGPNRFTLTGTTAAQDYPQTITRIHELSAVFKFKLTKNVMPKLEYRFQQFDNRDYQTTPMTPYMGCIGAGSVVVSPPCINVGPNVATPFPSPFYPGVVVGDTAAARFLFLGVDQPSYRAHILAVTVQYHF